MATDLTERDLIWNRACFAGSKDEDPRLRRGDNHLAAVLALDGFAKNGGLLHAVGVVGPAGLARALEGFRFFGLDEARAVAEGAGRIVARDRGTGDEEIRLDFEYDSAFCRTETIDDAFKRHFSLHPEDFAPLAARDRDPEPWKRKSAT